MFILKSDPSGEIKLEFFQALAESVLLYDCTTWTSKKCWEKKLVGNYTETLLNNITAVFFYKESYGIK